MLLVSWSGTLFKTVERLDYLCYLAVAIVVQYLYACMVNTS